MQWTKLEHGALKINIDTSSFGNPRHAAIKRLVHDKHDIWVIGFSGHIDISTNMPVALAAIRQGVLTVVNLEAANVELELNLFEAVNLVKTRDTFTHEFGIIIDDIKHIIAMNPMARIMHVFRETNRYANILIKMGANSCTPSILVGRPNFGFAVITFCLLHFHNIC